MRVNTHVTVALVSRLPLPLVKPDDPTFDRLAQLARQLATLAAPEETDEYAELQAIAARLYGLTPDEFEHVLNTFPLVSSEIRTAALRRLLSPAGHDTPRR